MTTKTKINNYKFDDIQNLYFKIQKIKKKSVLENIRDIVVDNNKNLSITESNNGIVFLFNRLSQDTYNKLEKYLDKYYQSEIEKNTTSINNSNDNFSELIKDSDQNLSYENSRLKFSNTEKTLIKKRLYDKALKQNSSINEVEFLNNNTDTTDSNKNNLDNNTNSIFIKKIKNKN